VRHRKGLHFAHADCIEVPRMARSLILLLLLAALVSIGCEGETAAEEARAGSALCPNGDFLDSGKNPCAQCAGLACDPGDKCSRGHTQGGVTCACHAGHMVCCSFSLPPQTGSCDYGPFPAPPCPAVRPAPGDPCEGPQMCAYSKPCCDSPPVAYCLTGGWVVPDGCDVPSRERACRDAGPDAPSDSGSSDAASDSGSSDAADGG
jgi:hypothetical protein